MRNWRGIFKAPLTTAFFRTPLTAAMWLGVAVLAAHAAAFAGALGNPPKASPQNAADRASQNVAGFAPLAQWRDAVLSGDKSAIGRFYVPDPNAPAPMPDGKNPTPANAETAFWSGLKALGLVALNPKLLQEESPQPGRLFLVLRVEMTFATAQGGKPRQQVIAMRQTWMQQGSAWHITATRRNPAEPLEAISLPQPATPDPYLYPAPGDAQTALTEALALARHDRKRVLVIFGATWCYDCHVLDATLRSPAVAPLVAANYHEIHVNIGDGNDNADLAARFQVPLDKGIPSLAVLDPDGRLVTSQKNGEFESAARIGMQDVIGFLERWKPPSKP